MKRFPLVFLAVTLLLSTGCKTMDSQTTKQAAALKQAHDAGILTDAEYQQKLQALQHAGATPPARAQAASAGGGKGNTWHMKRATFRQNTALAPMPQWGLQGRPGKDVDAMAMMVPLDWTFQARTAGGAFDCNMTAGRVLAVATSPDKTTGLAILPGRASLWSTDRGLLQSIQQTNQQFHQHRDCEIKQPQPLASAITGIVLRLNKEAQISGPMEPVPGLSDKLPAMLEQANRNLARQGAHVEATAGRIPIKGNEGGVATIGYFSALQVVRTDRLPSGGTVTTTDYPIEVGTFGPVDKFASLEPMFSAMLESVVIDPDYAAQSAQLSANILSIDQQTMQKLQRIQSEINEDNANSMRQRAQIMAGGAGLLGAGA